jgi:peroxiredoxin Q/BCP
MSKKSRKNSSKPAAKKFASAVSRTTAKKAVRSAAKATTKKAAKKPAKLSIKKAVKAPVPSTKPAPSKAAPKAGSATVKAPRATKSVPAVATSVATPATRTPQRAPASKPVRKFAAAPAVAIEGATAPSFELPSVGGATISLRDYAGQKLVIFFYPRANTPGCTKEAIDFTRLADAFAATNTAVLGVSADPLKAQESFRDKYELSIPLLSDETHAMLESYGVWGDKSMYGKTFQGVLRTTVLIDQDGQVARIWRNVKVDGHAEAVLEQASSL